MSKDKRNRDWSKWKWMGDQVLEVKTFKRSIQEFTPLERLEKLKKFTTFWISNHASYTYRRKRSFRAYGKCEVCEKGFAQVQHHMIMVSRGGVNKKYNRINICHSCHESIHPWMGVEKVGKNIDQEFRRFVAAM